MLFEAGGTVFIMNLKMRLRNISLTAYFKAILHYFGLNSLSGSMVDRCNQSPSVTPIGGERPVEPIQCGLPWCNINSTVQVSGKSKVSTVKSQAETHFRQTSISGDLLH